MTSDQTVSSPGRGTDASVPERSGWFGRVDPWLIVILGLAWTIGAARLLRPFFIRGDLLYHWGVARTILLGSIPPEGPYAGLPSYYPPGFHALLAATGGALGIDLETVTAVLGLVWLPVIPLTAFLLARTLTGRRSVSLTAAALTAFAGGLDVSADRLWVNSMTMVGHVALPLYPRDLVFGLLPLAVLAFVRALVPGRRWLAWAVLAGLILGCCGWLQVQLLLPMPPTLIALSLVTAVRRRDLLRQAFLAVSVTGVIGLAVLAPWLVSIIATIRANGGVSIDSSEDLLPVQISFWQYPIQFGIILPFTIIGVGVVLLLLRRADGPRPDGEPGRWSGARANAAFGLVPWWLVPFSLAVLYQPWWPLEDALRPQRTWLVASQPGLVLAAIGIVAAAEAAIARIQIAPDRRRVATLGLVAGAVVLASLPATVATQRLLWTIWEQPRYAHLSLDDDRVPDMAELLQVASPRPTILSYEDWSARIWYETGAAVVAIEPPGYAKLAFDPAAFTGHGQPERRLDLASALRGDRDVLASVAGDYGANDIVLARRGQTLALISQPARVTADHPWATVGEVRALRGNGWDAAVLEPGASLTFDIVAGESPIQLDIRMLRRFVVPIVVDRSGSSAIRTAPVDPAGTGRFELIAGGRSLATLNGPTGPGPEFAVVTATVTLPAGERLIVRAIDRIAIQAITGFVADPGPPPGWHVERTIVDAVLWARDP